MRRVVMFKKKSDAQWAEFDAALAGLVTLDQHMSEMDSWWVTTRDSGGSAWDGVLIADFADLDALSRYENHPKHVEVATGVAAVSEFAVFDTEA